MKAALLAAVLCLTPSFGQSTADLFKVAPVDNIKAVVSQIDCAQRFQEQEKELAGPSHPAGIVKACNSFKALIATEDRSALNYFVAGQSYMCPGPSDIFFAVDDHFGWAETKLKSKLADSINIGAFKDGMSSGVVFTDGKWTSLMKESISFYKYDGDSSFWTQFPLMRVNVSWETIQASTKQQDETMLTWLTINRSNGRFTAHYPFFADRGVPSSVKYAGQCLVFKHEFDPVIVDGKVTDAKGKWAVQ
jgi:hypothetical protein